MRCKVWIGSVLVLLTTAVYWPARLFEFTGFDDNLYVTANYQVRAGVTKDGLIWAFSSFHSSNWHPVTWLSHMLDCQFFGMNPAGPHLVNVGLHALNSVLLFALFASLTGEAWRSAMVAGLFAWHPMHVESVAWVSERKDVLSTCLGLLSLWCYARGKQPRPRNHAGISCRTGKVCYAISLLLFALALMAKPMMVTLPFVMMLLDYWPLRRFGKGVKGPKDQVPVSIGAQWFPLLAEKAPFLLLSVASGVVTFIAQQRGGSVVSLETESWGTRLGHVPLAYVSYMGKLLWPTGLCAFYSFATEPSIKLIVCSALLVLGISAGVCFFARTLPYLAVGWFWFLGTLIPVIGLIQVGGQSIADRYSYLPSVGLFIALVWGFADAARFLSKKPARLGAVGGGAILGACLWLTHRQLPYWHDSIALFGRAVAVNSRNPLALTNLGGALVNAGRIDEGKARLRQALDLLPNSPAARASIAVGLEAQEKTSEAIATYREVLRREPDMPEARNNLALILASDWETTNRNGAEAVSLARRACELTHNSQPPFLSTLAAAYAEAGQFEAAASAATRAIQIAARAGSTNFVTGESLRRELYLKHQPFHNAARPATQECVAAARLSDEGKSREAIDHYRKALELDPDHVDALNNLALILATDAAATNRNGAEAVRLAEKACKLTQYKTSMYVGTLAEAYAEAGRFEQAVATGSQAAAMFDKEGDQALAKLTRELVEMFRGERAYHEGM
jgi:tetratricopeptide (TPR) repeat protein